ncbi:hypothetical protein ACFCXS_36440 [Streptomyces sp. NPDC056373]|uniref:hypothetical protein n=1 Tax=Streptomyces sp. NPDC056373 TaxID=3345798 RepID=UPI0035E17C38
MTRRPHQAVPHAGRHAGDSGRRRRPAAGVDGDPLDVTFTFLDVNQPVTVQAPPSEGTADLAAAADEVQAG